MAIVWADFPSGQKGLYDTTINDMLNGIWAELATSLSGGSTVTLGDDPDPNIGSAGRVLRCFLDSSTSGAGTLGARFVYPAAVVTIGVGCRLWMSELPESSSHTPLISFRNASNTTIFAMRVLTTGAIEFRTVDTNGGSQIGATPGPVLVANAFNHIEIKSLRHASAGTIEVKVNGVSKLALTGLALGASDFAQVWVGVRKDTANLSSRTAYFKDVVFWDGLGSYATDFQGSISVHDLFTNADISLNWTPSTGSTGWNLLDEAPANDADYISADATPPAAAVFGLTNLPPDVTSVRALLPIFRGEKTDGGDCNVQSGLTPNNVDWVNGADVPMTTAYTYYWSPLHTSPATSAPWTPAEVNAAYVRVNRTL